MEVIIISKEDFLSMIEENNNKLKSLFLDKEEPTETHKEFLTTKEACAVFNTSRQNLYNKKNEGVIKQYRFGNKKYYKYDEIRSTILKSNEQ